MNKLKFIAWDKINKRWLDIEKEKDIRGHYMMNLFGEIAEVDISTGELDVDYLSNIELFQYSTLNDKNDKEIYTGHVLQLRNEQNKPYHMEVLWTGQGFGYRIIRNDMYRSGWIVGHSSERGLQFFNKTSEIIGHVRENPGLLDGVKG